MAAHNKLLAVKYNGPSGQTKKMKNLIPVSSCRASAYFRPRTVMHHTREHREERLKARKAKNIKLFVRRLIYLPIDQKNYPSTKYPLHCHSMQNFESIPEQHTPINKSKM
jgi:hypothetical protein